MSKYLTPTDVATQLGLAKPDAVFLWIRSGEITAINVATKPGGRPTWRISSADLQFFLEARRAKPAAPVTRRQPKRKLEGVTTYF